MNDKLILLFADMFTSRQKDNDEGFIILKSALVIKILHNLYEKLSLVDVPTIDTITKDEKTRYWNLAKKYYPDQETAIKASKAAYMIALITNSN